MGSLAGAGAWFSTMGSKKQIDKVHYDAIFTKIICRENKNLRLNTTFQINPRKFNKSKLVLLKKPLCRPIEIVPECPDFIEMFQRDQLPPNKKYKQPVTEAHEIGWHAAASEPRGRDETLEEWMAIFSGNDADCQREDCPLSSSYYNGPSCCENEPTDDDRVAAPQDAGEEGDAEE